jgi:hypothetical protein
MSRSVDRETIRSALEQTGGGWILKYWGEDADKQLGKIGSQLKAFAREYHRRFGEQPDVFGLLEVNPAKAAAFFQIDSLLASLEMKVMIWRILLGCDVAEISLHYKVDEQFSLRVNLGSPFGTGEAYATQDPSDFRVLRHLGLTGVDGQSVLQGYYAFRGAQ